MRILNLFVFLTAIHHSGPIDNDFCSAISTPNDSIQIIEKVYLHTDRTFYYPGDDIWFKAYLIDALDRSLTDHSNNLHVELISPMSDIISSKITRLERGLGNGDIRLPNDLKSGTYQLRAYTNFMRNYGDQLFFNKEIIVISPSDKKEDSSNRMNYVGDSIEVSFFPEGGSLINNVSSNVAFKAVNALGKGCDVSGEIYSSTGEMVTAFKSTHLGMGSFFLNPIPGLSYYSVIHSRDGLSIRTEIPKSLPIGVTLSVSANQNNELLITTKTNPQTLPGILDHDIILTCSARKTILKTISFKIKSFTNSLILPTEDLPDGVVLLTLSILDLPISERLVYINRENGLKINVESNKLLYKQREAVSLKISLTGDSITNQVGYFSLSSAEKNFTDNSSQFCSTISSWFLLESDVRGYVEEPSYYFDPSNHDRIKDLDLLLRTQGWRDFEWKYSNVVYTCENGFTISGRLRENIIDKPIADSKVNIGIFESGNNISMTVPTDSIGKFRLGGVDLTGEARLIVTAVEKKGHLQGLLLLDSIKYSPAPVHKPPVAYRSQIKNHVNTLEQEFEIKNTIKGKFKLSDTINLGEVTIISKKPVDLQSIKVESSRVLYGSPDNELLVTPQLQGYSNVIEIMQGRFPGVDIRKIPSGYTINIRGTHTINGKTQPLFLIDGRRSEMETIIGLPVQFIDRIDVLKSAGSTAVFGIEGTNGVISIITKTAERLTPYTPVSNSKNVKISGYDAPRIFYSPKHNPKFETSYKPDLRTTLLWEPNIILSPNNDLILEYYNADNSSTIKVLIEGLSVGGIPFTTMTEYEVR